MNKVNHFICPTCGHDFYDTGAYATCDACQTFFYAAQSRTSQRQVGLNEKPVGPMQGENTANQNYWRNR